MRNFRKWDIYQNAKTICIGIYNLTQSFPDEEKFGLISQLRRASVSMAANIAEGAGRNTDKDFKHFLAIAMGSAFEVEALLDLTVDLKLTEPQRAQQIREELEIWQKQTNNFMKRL
jgi:four helix bundle protein